MRLYWSLTLRPRSPFSGDKDVFTAAGEASAASSKASDGTSETSVVAGEAVSDGTDEAVSGDKDGYNVDGADGAAVGVGAGDDSVGGRGLLPSFGGTPEGSSCGGAVGGSSGAAVGSATGGIGKASSILHCSII